MSVIALTDEQFAWWLVGLVDGEGHFGVTKATHRVRPFYRCVFRVTLTAADRAVLEMAHDRTGWGRLYEYERPGAQNLDYVIWTSDAKSVDVIADFFETHPLQSKKRRDVELWAPAARAQATRIHSGAQRDDAAAAVMERAYEALRALDRAGRRRREAVAA